MRGCACVYVRWRPAAKWMTVKAEAGSGIIINPTLHILKQSAISTDSWLKLDYLHNIVIKKTLYDLT